MGIFGLGSNAAEDDEEDLDEEDYDEDAEDDDDAENLDDEDGEDGEGDKGNEDDPEDEDGKDPTQDEDGSLQDGDKPEKDPAQDGPGSKQDGPDKKDDKKDDKGGKGGLPVGKLKDPWDPLVTIEIAKEGGLPPIPIPYPCPTCKKMSLYLDTWINNGGRLTILLAYTIIMIIATKTCPTKINDVVQQVHFKCLNYKCPDFAFNAKKMKMVPNMTGGQLDKRAWIFASPFPKMTIRKAMGIQKKVTQKHKPGGGGDKGGQSGGGKGGLLSAVGGGPKKG